MTSLKFLFSFLILISLLTFSACTYDNEEDLFDDTECGVIEQVSLQDDIVPIFQTSCYGCHSTDVATAGIDLENYDDLKNVVDSGRLIGAIRHDPGFEAMPKGGNKLNECDIESISVWIQEGALNN